MGEPMTISWRVYVRLV